MLGRQNIINSNFLIEKNNKKSNQENYIKEINQINQKGGKVIASGGFGCIFTPELKCENSNNNEKRSPNKVSKLMINKYAIDEYKLIQKFKSILKSIPNYEDYFLLNGFTLCKPNQLTKEDLINYKTKCKALKKKNITKKNINQSLDKILSLNMPNGGIDVEDYIEKNEFVSSNIIKLNNSLIDLLKNGIVPMNKMNVYHCDIKDANVLVLQETNFFKTRLIDWGLSVNYRNGVGTEPIPRKLYRRPFQFNVPFSSILFNKEFIKKYQDFLSTTDFNPDYFQIREFVINYIFIWNSIRGPGHLNTINKIIKILTLKELPDIKKRTIKDHVIEYDFTYYYIVEYISKILEKYTNFEERKFELLTYFNNIFLKNIDIWGFTMIYITIVENLYNNFKILNQYQKELINKIKYIIIHFLYENPIEPINVNDLVIELTSLNEVIEKIGDIKYSKLNKKNKIIKKNKINKTNKNYTQQWKTNKTRKRRSFI